MSMDIELAGTKVERVGTISVFVFVAVLSAYTLLAALFGLIGPIDVALNVGAIALTGVLYFLLVTPYRHVISDIVWFTQFGIGAACIGYGLIAYFYPRYLTLGTTIMLLILMVHELAFWMWTSAFAVDDVPPLLKKLIPPRVRRYLPASLRPNDEKRSRLAELLRR